MPKKKKTLKQKMQADQLRQGNPKVVTSPPTPEPLHAAASGQEQRSPETQSGMFSLPTDYSKKHKETVKPHSMPVSTIAISTNEYSYLSKDLLKTGFLTIIIVLAELVIKFVFERG
ncbi:MAG: hypothetical protein ACREHC_05630 [Candidatus Levyibacteriota bacterium]